MATIQNTYTGNGSTTNYSFTFEYLDQSDVKAELDGTATTLFTFVNATTLGFNTAPGNGVDIRIFRDTSTETLKATFFPGSTIKAEDLNTNFQQNNFASQESKAASSQAPQALANSLSALTAANSAASDASVALTAVNNVVAAQAVADVAALAVLNTSGLSAQDQVEVFNSTDIQTYNTTYPSAPQITGAPVGFVGATDVTVKLVWTGSAWTWNSYSPTDPDNRYYTQSVADNRYYTQSVADNRYQQLDAGLTYLDGLNFTNEATFKQGVNLEVGVDVQAYDADTAKLDVAQTFSATQTFAADQTYPKIPANTKTAAYTLVVADAGKHINITTGGVTVPSSVFSIGDAVSIYNNSASDQTITQDTGVTLRQVGTANTGNRTLAQYGLATILCVASDTFVISGGGLS
jgi:hypothetical protein